MSIVNTIRRDRRGVKSAELTECIVRDSLFSRLLANSLQLMEFS
jgi:hypothetical protein